MTDQNPQIPHGYYYAPLQSGGPLEQWFGIAGNVVGKSLGAAAGIDIAGAIDPVLVDVGKSLGGYTGGKGGQATGEAIGNFLDNVNTLIQNVNTFFEQVNYDYQSVQDPMADQ